MRASVKCKYPSLPSTLSTPYWSATSLRNSAKNSFSRAASPSSKILPEIIPADVTMMILFFFSPSDFVASAIVRIICFFSVSPTISPPFEVILPRQKSFINSRNGLKRPSAGTAHPALMMAGQTP
nr:MAG TPA: hypothetical protein [Caudoviricetes sp.]